MSQKTNPLSLRLQKGGNHHFSSPWFTDVFFSDTFQHESSIKRYIDRLLKETQYSKAFFSTKSFYRKFNILFSIQDTRAQKKEKQLLFNLKSNLSGKKQSLASKSVKNLFALASSEMMHDALLTPKVYAKCKLNSLHLLCRASSMQEDAKTHQSVEVNLPHVVDNSTLFSKNDVLSCKDDRSFFLASEMPAPSGQDNTSYSLILEGSQTRCFSNFFRNKVRNDFIKFKQNYNLRSFAKTPAHKSETTFSDSITFLASNMYSAPSSLILEESQMQLEEIVDYSYGTTILADPSTHYALTSSPLRVFNQRLYSALCCASLDAKERITCKGGVKGSMHPALLTPKVYAKCEEGKLSFIELLSRSFAQAQQKYFQKIIKNRNCLTYCEKIVSQHFVTENIKQKQKLDFSSVFLGNALFENIKFFSDSKNWHFRDEENYTSILYNLKMQNIASVILSGSKKGLYQMPRGEKNNRFSLQDNACAYTEGVKHRCITPSLHVRAEYKPLVENAHASALKLKKPITHFEPIRFVNATQSVTALLDQIVALLERRVSFREIKSKLFKNVERNCLIKGVRFSCSGRLGGRSKKAQKAKTQSYHWGATSLNAFSSKIVFANKSATTSYGKVGVKIWLSFKDD